MKKIKILMVALTAAFGLQTASAFDITVNINSLANGGIGLSDGSPLPVGATVEFGTWDAVSSVFSGFGTINVLQASDFVPGFPGYFQNALLAAAESTEQAAGQSYDLYRDAVAANAIVASRWLFGTEEAIIIDAQGTEYADWDDPITGNPVSSTTPTLWTLDSTDTVAVGTIGPALEAAAGGNSIYLIPEPSTALLLLTGLGFQVLRRRRA